MQSPGASGLCQYGSLRLKRQWHPSISGREICAQAIRRTYSSPVGDFIKEQCLGVAKRIWRKGKKKALCPRAAPVIVERIEWAEAREKWLGTGKKAVQKEWKYRWLSTKRPRRWCSIASEQEPSSFPLKLHAGLYKAQSSVLVQLRSGINGLAHTLSKLHVPGFESPECACEEGGETGEHVLLHCPLEDERRAWFRGTSFKELVTEPLRAYDTTRWVIKSGRLGQYSLANKLLFTDKEGRP